MKDWLFAFSQFLPLAMSACTCDPWSRERWRTSFSVCCLKSASRTAWSTVMDLIRYGRLHCGWQLSTSPSLWGLYIPDHCLVTKCVDHSSSGFKRHHGLSPALWLFPSAVGTAHLMILQPGSQKVQTSSQLPAWSWATHWNRAAANPRPSVMWVNNKCHCMPLRIGDCLLLQ